MKKSILFILVLVVLIHSAHAQKLTWSTKSKIANDFAQKGARFMSNGEFALAYPQFLQALKLDPGFTMASWCMTYLTDGELRKKYVDMAIKSSLNKTAGEKLLVSLLDEKYTAENRANIWKELYVMFPADPFIHGAYAFFSSTDEQRFTAWN